MSTYADRELRCTGCGHVWTTPILTGIHSTRLPEVRAAILEGTFQVIACPGCGATARVEAVTVYTDFERGHYLAVEMPAPEDWRATRGAAVKVFDDAFLFGPPIAQEMVLHMRCRVVFGLRALREKLLIWDADLNDRVVESLKAAWLRDHGLGPRDETLRVVLIHQGGHMLLGRFTREDRATSPDVPIGYVTFPNAAYQAALSGYSRIAGELPWLADDWVVDHWITASEPGAPRP
jgi:hypothetical protein